MAVIAVSADGQRPWDFSHHTLATVNTWEGFLMPKWVRKVRIRNTHAAGTLRVAARNTADALAAPGAVLNWPIAPLGELDVPISGGQAQALDSAMRTIAFHSTQASQTFSLELLAAD